MKLSGQSKAAVLYGVIPFFGGFGSVWILCAFGAFRFSPRPDFLTLIAAFEGMAVSVAIPLSFNMASRISERYQSEVITQSFTRMTEVILLPRLTIFFIILTVLQRFSINRNVLSLLTRFLNWIVLFGFVAIAIILLLFLIRLERFITNVDSVLDRLFDEAEEFFE